MDEVDDLERENKILRRENHRLAGRVATLEREIGPLRTQNAHLNSEIEKLSRSVTSQLPVSTFSMNGKQVRCTVIDSAPLFLASDVFALLKEPTRRRRRYHRGGERLYPVESYAATASAKAAAFGFSKREVVSIWRADIARQWKTADRLVSDAFGASRKTQQISFVTEAGASAIRKHFSESVGAWLAERVLPALATGEGRQ